jgi:sporulation protein YlmC with PRC-barrel domain
VAPGQPAPASSPRHRRNLPRPTTTEGQQTPTETQPSTTEAVGSYKIRASNLIGKEVRNPQDEEIGEVDDLVITQDGQVHAIISVGGFLGMGEHLVAVPYNELQPGPEGEDYLTYSATKEQLKSQPEFKYEQGEAGLGMQKEGEEREMKEGEAAQEEKAY